MNELDKFFTEDNLTAYNHGLVDSHIIGKDLASPPAGITAAVGVSSYEGISPIVARADHRHSGQVTFTDTPTGAHIFVGNTAPTSPSVNDLWIKYN